MRACVRAYVCVCGRMDGGIVEYSNVVFAKLGLLLVLMQFSGSERLCVVIGERAKRARHYEGCTNSSWCGIYIYMYVWRYVCHISSTCHAYVMWAELGHSHFLYVPAVLYVVTTGNGTGTKNVLKWNRVLGFEFSIQSSV